MSLIRAFEQKRRRGIRGIENASANQQARELLGERQEQALKDGRNANALTAGTTLATNSDKIIAGAGKLGEFLQIGEQAAAPIVDAGITAAGTTAGVTAGVEAGTTAVVTAAPTVVAPLAAGAVAPVVAPTAGLTAATAIPFVGWGIAIAGLLGMF